MATIKIVLFDSPSKQLKDQTFPICLKVTHQQKRKYFNLGKYCEKPTPDGKNAWSKVASRFTKYYAKDFEKENIVLSKIETNANDILDDFKKENIPFSFELFNEKFLKEEKSELVKDVFTKHVDKLLKENKPSAAAPFKSTLNSLLDFIKTDDKYNGKIKADDFKFIHINYKFLIDYEHWLKTERQCKETSIAVYMKELRSMINKAIKAKDIAQSHQPFNEYSITARLSLKTKKRAIDKAKIEEIAALQFPDFSKEQLAQNIFLFSFYTRGMNFVDIAYLTPKNIIGDRLEYIRSKTKQSFSIKILQPVKEILDFYIANNKATKGDFIFPIFDESKHITAYQKFNRKKTVNRDVNSTLKDIAEMVGLENIKLTTYVSRHSYATILKKAKIPIAEISEALGHQTEKITATYLKQFENNVLDEADKNLL
jgi:integrase/recombinase XerD